MSRQQPHGATWGVLAWRMTRYALRLKREAVAFMRAQSNRKERSYDDTSEAYWRWLSGN